MPETVNAAVKPDPRLLDEYPDDAAKASRLALEATLRMLATSFEQQIRRASPTVPTLVLAGRADTLLGLEVQKTIGALYPASKVVELECGHEILIEAPAEAAAYITDFVRREWQLTVPPVRCGRTSLWTGVIPG